MDLYDKNYYECGIETGKSCYNNYRWIPELTIPMGSRLIENLNISLSDKVLDFGCAKGYLVHSFRLLGRECWGYDLSQYAIENSPTEVKPFVTNNLSEITTKQFDWVIAKDVLEHVPYEEIQKTLNMFRKISKNLFILVPLGRDGEYEIPAYELDTTHIIREPIDWWTEKMELAGFEVVQSVHEMPGIKENWKQYIHGNGFLVGG